MSKSRSIIIALAICVILETIPVVLGQSNVGPYFSFESHNYPGEFIRHANYLGERTPISSRLDQMDSTFALRPGLADNINYVSFEAYNYRGYFLRHQDFRLKLNQETSDQLFKEDATFKIVHGLSDSQAVSFQSYNYPNRYIRHRDGHLWVEENDNSQLFKEDATFFRVAPNAQDDTRDGVPEIANESVPGQAAAWWQGMNEDKVGEWDSGSPNGRNDGHFLLTLSLPRQIEIKSIAIYSADANGNHVGGQVWDTASTSYWILGVFYQGNQLDQHHVSSLGNFSGNVQFDLYGDDSGWFKSGNWFEVEVILGDGTKLTKLISISSNVDLTGVWDCDDGGTYYIRQIENTVWWDGDDTANHHWANVARGTISGSIVTLDYADVPEGDANGYGTLVLDIISNDELKAKEKPESYGGSHWVRSSKNPPPDTNPWDNTSVRQLIDEWLLQQDKCIKTVYPGAYVDKWGRICGDTGMTTISCVLTPDHPADWDNYHYLWYNNWCPDYYPYRVQDYVRLRQSGSSFDDLAKCKSKNEACY